MRIRMTIPPTTPPAIAPAEECLDDDPVVVLMPVVEESGAPSVRFGGEDPVDVKTMIVPFDVLVTAISVLEPVRDSEDAAALEPETEFATEL